MTPDDRYRRATAAAFAATDAAAELLRACCEHDLEEPGVRDETIERLLDAAKMAIEVEQDDDLGAGELGQIYGAICKFLEGWAG